MRLVAAALPYLVFAVLSAVSWNRWIEPYVDTGRELVVPWRVAQGERLYRDVRFYYGPLAVYAAAGVERAAGRSLPARIALAAAIAMLHLEALRRAARLALTPGRAALAASLAVAVAFFLRPGGCHLFPYSLSTAVAVTAATWSLVLAADPRRPRGAAVGIGLFAALTSRPEIGLAAAVLVIVTATSASRRRAFLAAGSAITAAALVYTLVSSGTPLESLRGEGWLAFVSVPPEFRNVYRAFSGLDRPGLRLAELALAMVLLVVLAAGLVLLAFLSRARGRGVAIAMAALSLAAAAAIRLWPPASLEESLSLLPPLIRPLPLFLLGGAVWRLLARLRHREDGGIFASVPDGFLYLSALFASRLLLAAGYVGPYDGFFLPLPVVVATAGVFGLADRVASRLQLPALPRLTGAALAVFLAARAASLAQLYRAPGWQLVLTPAGNLRMREPYAIATRMALAVLEEYTPPGGTMIGFPEAGFLQYVVGRKGALPEDQFFPGHLDAAAERRAIESLEAAPPDAVVYVNVLTVGHGALAFGKDYLRDLDGAARAVSQTAAYFGPGGRVGARIGDPDFFIEVRVPRPREAR